MKLKDIIYAIFHQREKRLEEEELHRKVDKAHDEARNALDSLRDMLREIREEHNAR